MSYTVVEIDLKSWRIETLHYLPSFPTTLSCPPLLSSTSISVFFRCIANGALLQYT